MTTAWLSSLLPTGGRSGDPREIPHGNATHDNPKGMRKRNSAAVEPPDHGMRRHNSKIRGSNEKPDNTTYLQNQNHARKSCEEVVLQRDEKYRSLEEDYRNLEQSLRDCKDQIFSFQPVESATEQQIREQYNGLCESVQSWVKAGFLSSDDFVKSFLNANFKAEENALARELLSHLCVGISEVTLELYPFTAVNFLCCLVQRYLDRRVLNATDTFPGLDKGLCGAIQHIGDGIRQLSRPERGEDRVAFWKAEAYRALFNQQSDSAKSLDDEAKELTESFKAILFPVIPEDQQAGVMDGFQNQVAMEALNLSSNILTSAATYYFDYEEAPSHSTDAAAVLRIKDLDRFKIVDIASPLLPLKRTDKELRGASDSTIVGHFLCVMHPALCRIVAKGEKKVLSKPVLLMERKRRPRVASAAEEASQPASERPETGREAPDNHNLCTSQEQRYTNEECPEDVRDCDDERCEPNPSGEGRIEQEET